MICWLIYTLDFQSIINELELLDNVEKKDFSFKDLAGPVQRPAFSSLRNFWHSSWIFPILAICGIAVWRWRRLRRAPDPAIAKQTEIEVKPIHQPNSSGKPSSLFSFDVGTPEESRTG